MHPALPLATILTTLAIIASTASGSEYRPRPLPRHVARSAASQTSAFYFESKSPAAYDPSNSKSSFSNLHSENSSVASTWVSLVSPTPTCTTTLYLEPVFTAGPTSTVWAKTITSAHGLDCSGCDLAILVGGHVYQVVEYTTTVTVSSTTTEYTAECMASL